MSRFETSGMLKEVKLSQGTVRYRESGVGEPLVFVHGLLVNGDLWRKVVPPLAKKYRCIVPDLPLGSHEVGLAPQADLSTPGVARLIADFIAALDLNNVTLLGTDTGGAFSQVVATEHPERLARLILIDCDAYHNFLPISFRFAHGKAYIPGTTFLLAQLLKTNFMQKLSLALVIKYPVESRAAQSYFDPITKSKAIRHDLTKVLKGISNRYTLKAATKFANFTKPVLIVWGDKDFLFPLKHAYRLQRAFPNGRLVIVKDSRAFVMEDQPAHLIEAIESFIGSYSLV